MRVLCKEAGYFDASPARIIATVERLSDDDVAGITAATINMLVDLEAVEAAELVQSRRLVEQDDDIPF